MFDEAGVLERDSTAATDGTKPGRRSGLILAELILIVAGVLIALAVDAWNDDRLEARNERLYVQQLLEDLDETDRQFAAASQRNLEPGRANAQLLAGFRSPPYPSNDSTRAWLARVSFIDNPVPVVGTAEALVSTGDLRLLRNLESRAAITRWMSRVRDYWLVPLYQLEELHRIKYYELVAHVDPMALAMPGRVLADSIFGYRRPHETTYALDGASFFNDRGAYALLTDLYHLKISMGGYRIAMRREAGELRSVLAF